MKILKCHLNDIDPRVIGEAVRVLREGGVVAHPTDTCYGLAVDITNPEAIKRLYALKGLPPDKPVSVLASSVEEAQRYGRFDELTLRLAREFWPGPLTIVMPKSESFPAFLNSGIETVGWRVIDEPVSVALLKAFGGPVTTTSANFHGKPSPYSVAEISVEPDLVIDAGELTAREKPSTIVEVKKGKATILRQGGLFLELGP